MALGLHDVGQKMSSLSRNLTRVVSLSLKIAKIRGDHDFYSNLEYADPSDVKKVLVEAEEERFSEMRLFSGQVEDIADYLREKPIDFIFSHWIGKHYETGIVNLDGLDKTAETQQNFLRFFALLTYMSEKDPLALYDAFSGIRLKSQATLRFKPYFSKFSVSKIDPTDWDRWGVYVMGTNGNPDKEADREIDQRYDPNAATNIDALSGRLKETGLELRIVPDYHRV